MIAEIIVASLTITVVILIIVIVKRSTRKQKSLTEKWVDYTNTEKRLTFRIFPSQFEYDAGENIPVHKILDAGNLGNGYSFYLIEK